MLICIVPPNDTCWMNIYKISIFFCDLPIINEDAFPNIGNAQLVMYVYFFRMPKHVILGNIYSSKESFENHL